MPIIATAPSLATPPPTTPKRASLAGMPTEIKARIVELAWYQDERYWDGEAAGASEIPAINVYKECFGKSVGALFQVNREFSELSAKYVFRSLDLGLDTTCTLFQHGIIPFRAHHFVHLTLNATFSQAGLKRSASALFVAGQLPNLRSLLIDNQFEDLYLNKNLMVNKLERDLVLRSFERLTSRVEKLSFNGKWLSQSMLKVLRGASALKTLRLILANKDDNRQDREDLLNFITKQTHLENLDLGLHSKEVWNFSTTSLPHLTSLTCLNWHCDEDSSLILPHFSGQLVELATSSKHLIASSPTTSPPSSTPLSFPLLRELNLSTASSGLDFVEGLQAFNFPRVSSLILHTLEPAEFWTNRLSNVLDQFPSLVSLYIDFYPPLSATQSTQLLQLCAQRNIHLECDSLYSPFDSSVEELPITLTEHEARNAHMVEEAKRGANFMARRIERLETWGDLGEIEKMMPFIQGLAEIMAMEEA